MERAELDYRALAGVLPDMIWHGAWHGKSGLGAAKWSPLES